jgi:tetratricopeptide (TPR) repeat protein
MQNRYLLSVVAFCAVVAPKLRAIQRTPPSCEQYQAAVLADPNNLEAAVTLGRCTVRDESMIAPDGDSTRLMFRTSWGPAIRALRHAVALNPSYSPAYRPLFRMLFAETRDGCSYITGECLHVAPVLRSGDSMLTVPRLVRSNEFPGTYGEVTQEAQATRRENLTEASELAQRWVAVAPNDRRPHEYLGQALLRLGDVAPAAEELERAAALGTLESRRDLFWQRLETFIRTDRGADARRVLDEAVSDPGRDTMQLHAYVVSGLNAFLGRYRPAPYDTLGQKKRFEALMPSMPARAPASRMPTFSELLARGDTNGARRMLAVMDARLAPPKAGTFRSPDADEDNLFSALDHLVLKDTAGALARLEEIERPLKNAWFPRNIGAAYGERPWTGRAWLLSGDLAAAQGRLEDARRMYRRVIGLWGGGDAALQSVVQQARARLDVIPAR